MERLTKRVSNNRGHLARCYVCGNRCAEKCTECVDLGDALYKLAEYEDTGLTPEEVVKLKLYTEKIQNYLKQELTYSELKSGLEAKHLEQVKQINKEIAKEDKNT